MKKLHIFQIGFIILFVIFLIILLMPKNYTKEYTKNEINISETYNKETKSYYFTFIYQDITLDYLVESNYKEHRTLINDIEIVKDDDNNFCLIPKSNEIEMIPLCYDNEQIIHYSLVNNNLKKELDSNLFVKDSLIESYNDIDIYNNDYTYLLWNYDGFYYLTKENKEKIEIFDKEIYNVNLIGYTKDYLVIADYDSNYTFNNIYTINFKKGNLKKYTINRNIYFDSYFIGYEKNKLYIVDNKEELMYELNAKNGEINKIKSKILKDGSWENVKIKTLINKKTEFTYKTNFNYELVDNSIYLSYKDIKTLVTRDVTSIVKISDENIFYLKNADLYHFSPNKGEEKLLSYFEWNFNYERMIYIN